MNVEIWSDIACPWCYLGKRRFEAALAEFEHRGDVRVIWRSFELDPSAPAERPGDRAEHLAAKYGCTVEDARRIHEGMTQVAAGEGLEFRFDIARDGSTFDAHRLLQLAVEHGLQGELKERFLRAHFTEGERLGDRATLERLAVDVGLPRDEVADVLAGDRYAADVREDERMAQALGIHAVPFFVVDRTVGVSGAQRPEVLAELLRRGWEERSPQSPGSPGSSGSPGSPESSVTGAAAGGGSGLSSAGESVSSSAVGHGPPRTGAP